MKLLLGLAIQDKNLLGTSRMTKELFIIKENHYRRHFKDYLVAMKAKKLIEASTSCAFMIE